MDGNKCDDSEMNIIGLVCLGWLVQRAYGERYIFHPQLYIVYLRSTYVLHMYITTSCEFFIRSIRHLLPSAVHRPPRPFISSCFIRLSFFFSIPPPASPLFHIRRSNTQSQNADIHPM